MHFPSCRGTIADIAEHVFFLELLRTDKLIIENLKALQAAEGIKEKQLRQVCCSGLGLYFNDTNTIQYKAEADNLNARLFIPYKNIKYTGQLLGEGGTARVYAFSLQLPNTKNSLQVERASVNGREVAVKRLKGNSLAGLLRQFVFEIRVMHFLRTTHNAMPYVHQ